MRNRTERMPINLNSLIWAGDEYDWLYQVLQAKISTSWGLQSITKKGCWWAKKKCIRNATTKKLSDRFINSSLMVWHPQRKYCSFTSSILNSSNGPLLLWRPIWSNNRVYYAWMLLFWCVKDLGDCRSPLSLLVGCWVDPEALLEANKYVS